MTARMIEVEVQIVNHCSFGDGHRWAVTRQQIGNNSASWMLCRSINSQAQQMNAFRRLHAGKKVATT